MTRFHQWIWTGLLTSVLCGCGSAPSESTSPAESVQVRIRESGETVLHNWQEVVSLQGLGAAAKVTVVGYVDHRFTETERDGRRGGGAEGGVAMHADGAHAIQKGGARISDWGGHPSGGTVSIDSDGAARVGIPAAVVQSLRLMWFLP